MNRRKVTITGLIGVILLLLYFTFYNFNGNEKASVVGSYESLAPTLVEKAKFAFSNIECFYSGKQLKLMADSTFTLIDDTNILTGKWHQELDIINLHFLSNRYMSDSLLNKFGEPGVPLKDYVLKWSNPDLQGFLTDSVQKCAELFKVKP